VVYAIQMVLAFRNTARRDATATNITNKLGTSTLYGTPQVDSLPNLRNGTNPALIVTARFTTVAERDSVWTQLDTFLGTGINGPTAGSRAWIHDCPHDEDTGGCVLDAERVW
jgi:hypothetical protein